MNKTDGNPATNQYALGDPAIGKGGAPRGDANPTTATAPAQTATVPPPVVTPPPQAPPPQAAATREPDPAPTPRREQPRRTPVTPTPTQQASPPVQTPTQTPAQTPPASTRSPAGAATLQLSLNPPGIVSINGVSHGERGRYSTEVTAGTHQVRVEKAGFVTKDTTITVAAGARVTIRLSMEARP